VHETKRTLVTSVHCVLRSLVPLVAYAAMFHHSADITSRRPDLTIPLNGNVFVCVSLCACCMCTWEHPTFSCYYNRNSEYVKRGYVTVWQIDCYSFLGVESISWKLHSPKLGVYNFIQTAGFRCWISIACSSFTHCRLANIYKCLLRTDWCIDTC